jgi:peptidoglycan/xylan/chitin deacetylase (PgdA/CDA1 family)
MKAALAITAVICGLLITAGVLVGSLLRPHPAPFVVRTVSVTGIQPLDDNASAGRVVFTFDDGPDVYTPALLAEMKRLHLRGVFFVFGVKAQTHPQLIREEAADGDLVENHTYAHASFTGASTDTPPLSAAEIKSELVSTQQAIVAAGVPKPTLYRAPFGDITAADNAIAAKLGLRTVQPFSVVPDGNIVDSRDWTGISAAQIAHDVEYGYRAKQGKLPGLAQGARVIGFHDSAPECQQQPVLCGYMVNTIKSLPLIVAWMNRHNLGVTTVVPANATGGAVPNLAVSK